MYERMTEEVTIPAKSSKRIRFVQQQTKRELVGVTIFDGGDDIRIGQVDIGVEMNVRIGGNKPVPWPIAVAAFVRVHNDSNEERKMTVELLDRAEGDAPESPTAEKRRVNPKPSVRHTITILVMDDGNVHGAVDKQPLYPRPDSGTVPLLNEQAESILFQALGKIVENEFNRKIG